jgi:hypothetical protein
MGVPAVVTNIRGCRQTVDDGVTGHLVPLRDPEALAGALLDLLGDDEKRAAFGRAAREKALAEFDERAVFRKVVAAYEELLGGGAGGPPAAAGQESVRGSQPPGPRPEDRHPGQEAVGSPGAGPRGGRPSSRPAN